MNTAPVAHAAAALLALSLPASTLAADPPTDLELLTDITGRWSGVLEYADGMSGRRVELPAVVEAEASPDGAQAIWRYTYTDPGYEVHMMDVATVDAEAEKLISVFFSGTVVEKREWRFVQREVESVTEWRVVIESANAEGGLVRIDRRRDGDTITSTAFDLDTSVDPPAWKFANELRIEREDAASDPAD